MVLKRLVGLAIGHQAAVIFTGGVAAAVIGKKVLESDIVKDTATNALAEVISIKQDAEKIVSDMKAEAEEIVVESKK